MSRSLLISTVFLAELCLGQSVRLNNTASSAEGGRFNWTVFLETDSTTLTTIEGVVYTLHPTFPNPIRKVTRGREKGYPLSSNGWGEFTIYAEILFSDGTSETIKYWLDLSKTNRHPEGLKARGDSVLHRAGVTGRVDSLKIDALSAGNTSKYLGHGKWEWTVFVSASDHVLNEIRHVDYTLHPTFADPIRRVTKREFEPGKGFALKATGWGTFEIGVKVEFGDGKTKYLRHRLRFI